MSVESCSNCRFSKPDNTGYRCRRFPPQVAHYGRDLERESGCNIYTEPVFPYVSGEDWCGEWKAEVGN